MNEIFKQASTLSTVSDLDSTVSEPLEPTTWEFIITGPSAGGRSDATGSGNSSLFPDCSICRICHGGQSFGELLQPCRCRGTIAFAHRECLEHWLKESTLSHCELCLQHFQIIKEPKYSTPTSILVWLLQPGEHTKTLILDTIAVCLYTPAAVMSTCILLMLCESAANGSLDNKNYSSHIVALAALSGLAAIDFSYSSWLAMTIQKHVHAWRQWHARNSTFHVVLPEMDSLQKPTT